MLGLLAPTLVAVVVALGLGGSLRGFLRAGIRGWPAMLATFAVELVLYNPPVDRQAWAMQIGPWIWLATKLVLLGVLMWNALPSAGRVSRPWLLAALGIGLNTLAIGLNDGHMPQSTFCSRVGSMWLEPHRARAASVDCGMWPSFKPMTSVLSPIPTAASSHGRDTRPADGRAFQIRTASSTSLVASQIQGPICIAHAWRSTGGL